MEFPRFLVSGFPRSLGQIGSRDRSAKRIPALSRCASAARAVPPLTAIIDDQSTVTARSSRRNNKIALADQFDTTGEREKGNQL